MKVVFLTGVSGLLGTYLTKDLLRNGYKVYGIARSKEKLDNLHNVLSNKDHFESKQLDVLDAKGIQSYIQEIVEKEGRLDVVINNAGYVHELFRVEDTPEEEFDINFDVNVKGVFNVCKVVLPYMQKMEKSTLINVSSMAGVRGVPRLAIYSASKFAVSGFTQAMAKENYEHNVRCLTVSPGGMNTPMRAKAFGAENAKKQQSPEKVANIIFKIIDEQIPVDTGSDVAIRFEKIIGLTKSPDV